MYLSHHTSRLPSGLPSCEDRRGVSREHAKPIKTVKVDFVKTFERRRRPRVLRASRTCLRVMACRGTAIGSRWNERDEILANTRFLQKLHPRARFAGWRPSSVRHAMCECIFVAAVTRSKFAKHSTTSDGVQGHPTDVTAVLAALADKRPRRTAGSDNRIVL